MPTEAWYGSAYVSSCWCQHSYGEAVADHVVEGSYWSTCLMKAPEEMPEEAPAEDGPDPNVIHGVEGSGCIGEFGRTNYFGKNGETYVGYFDTVADCVAAVKATGEHDVANMQWEAIVNGTSSSCYAQHTYGEEVDETVLDPYGMWGSCLTSMAAYEGEATSTEEATASDTANDTTIPVNGTEGFADGCHSEWV